MTAERAARVQLRSIKITSVASMSRFIQHIWHTFSYKICYYSSAAAKGTR